MSVPTAERMKTVSDSNERRALRAVQAVLPTNREATEAELDEALESIAYVYDKMNWPVNWGAVVHMAHIGLKDF